MVLYYLALLTKCFQCRNEFNYFIDKITSITTAGKKNLLVSGRKSYEPFPKSCMPLPNCYIAVLSRTLNSVPKHAHYLCRDLPSAIKLASTPPLSKEIETIWIIGGVETYIEAMKHPWCELLYLTEIMAEFDCDTFFPEFDRKVYKLVDEFPGVPTGIQEEEGIKYKFHVFKRDATLKN
ncbi:zgc:153031 isoform X1 [Latimeria chalumnae]|uniref:zgc:153031 isoform X1 n=1 Tax=Latimeria chalumnae TaxID=7897 RepID=UPI00025190BD